MCLFDLFACIYIFYAAYHKTSETAEKVVKIIKGGMILHLCLNVLALMVGGFCSFLADDCDPYMNMIYYGIPVWAALDIFGVLLFIVLSVIMCAVSYVYAWKYETYATDYED